MLKHRIARIPGARRFADAVVPSRRAARDQWRRIDRAVGVVTVQSGPFAGMRLVGSATGSHIPKRLGCYEQELHDLIDRWQPYDTVLDVGCGEGYYVVGLARRWPAASVHGFDISDRARAECQAAALANGVEVQVHPAATAAVLASYVQGRTVVICDAEGAEAEVLDPDRGPALHTADVLVELHDFLVPGVTAELLGRFPARQPLFLDQQPRNRELHPLLDGLNDADSSRALSESRPPAQRWLWLAAPPAGDGLPAERLVSG